MPKQLSLSNLQVALQKREKKMRFSFSLGFHYISRLAAANIGCASEKQSKAFLFAQLSLYL